MAENLSLVAQLIIDRTKALVAIQELHEGKPCKVGGCDCMACVHCDREWPCRTRRLADDALGGEQDG